IPLSLNCIVVNALLLVPDGKTTWTNNNLSLQVWLMGGFIGGGLMIRISAIQAVGMGCCGAGCCGNRYRMLPSVFSSTFGMLGAIYCQLVSGAGLQIGPKCLINNKWDYHFEETFNNTLWDLCEAPPHMVPWNVMLFSVLVVASSLETVLCGIQLVNVTIGAFCGDCRKKEVGQHGVELGRESTCSWLPP
uniref:Transmembrane 4 superfamily member 5 n=1 Tax=Nannospalax galili TaxID=1026970 RepID=A0A8C6RPA3_NANGA